jgi:hypothetical protein
MATTSPSSTAEFVEGEVGTASEIRAIPGGRLTASTIWCGRNAREKEELTTWPTVSLVQTGARAQQWRPRSGPRWSLTEVLVCGLGCVGPAGITPGASPPVFLFLF